MRTDEHVSLLLRQTVPVAHVCIYSPAPKQPRREAEEVVVEVAAVDFSSASAAAARDLLLLLLQR